MTVNLARYTKRIGERFGSLTLVGLADTRGDGSRIFGKFSCDCGTAIERPIGRVISGSAPQHCGCQTDHGTHRRHGMRYSREYSSWTAMKRRCLDPKHKDFPRWGGAGVTICPEWIGSFKAFYAHIGPRPAKTTLDRIDGTMGYKPGNVRWATVSEQQRNTRSACRWSIKGMIFESLEDAARHFGVDQSTIWEWVRGKRDSRRGTHRPPREDCHAINRY